MAGWRGWSGMGWSWVENGLCEARRGHSASSTLASAFASAFAFRSLRQRQRQRLRLRRVPMDDVAATVVLGQPLLGERWGLFGLRRVPRVLRAGQPVDHPQYFHSRDRRVLRWDLRLLLWSTAEGPEPGELGQQFVLAQGELARDGAAVLQRHVRVEAAAIHGVAAQHV